VCPKITGLFCASSPTRVTSHSPRVTGHKITQLSSDTPGGSPMKMSKKLAVKWLCGLCRVATGSIEVWLCGGLGRPALWQRASLCCLHRDTLHPLHPRRTLGPAAPTGGDPRVCAAHIFCVSPPSAAVPRLESRLHTASALHFRCMPVVVTLEVPQDVILALGAAIRPCAEQAPPSKSTPDSLQNV
jgi:hypothetical protein